MKQVTFASLVYENKKKTTRREVFLAQMEGVVPWPELLSLIEPHYPKVGKRGGRPPMPLATMFRIYCLQQWYTLSDALMEDYLYESEPMRRFAGLELGEDAIPDETTILHFRHLLEKHALTEAIFECVKRYLSDKNILLKSGTMVDATLIAAPTSTKNKEGKRSPEMTSTKKGNDWHYGMKAHIGVDAQSGLVHTLVTTTAKVHDSQCTDELQHGEETALYGDKGYVSAERERAFTAQGKLWGVMLKAAKGKKLDRLEREANRIISSIRARVEHPFRVLKCQFGYVKTRYRGLAKNTAQLFSLFALGNLYMARRRLQLQDSCA